MLGGLDNLRLRSCARLGKTHGSNADGNDDDDGDDDDGGASDDDASLRSELTMVVMTVVTMLTVMVGVMATG